MNFRIADTFTDSLAKLTGDEQKAVKTTAFDLQMNPAQPGMSFHKLDKAKDKNFWSVRVNNDIRVIVHRTNASLLLCYVDHHDKAYSWAERRKIETHPKTGAAQIVEIRETVQEIKIPKYVEVDQSSQPKSTLFSLMTDEELLIYGVPPEWLSDVRHATEDTLLQIADHLPKEASEALLELAVGGTPLISKVAEKITDPFSHPDAQRRFRIMNNVEELERALEFPWEKWTIFLHPDQKQIVDKYYNGPAKVYGSAGTGKTIVALHRAVYLARKNTDARVLLTTFSDTLANSLKTKLKKLISNEPKLADRLEVHSLNTVGERLYEKHFSKPQLILKNKIKEMLISAASNSDAKKFNSNFLLSEWEDIVDAWQIDSWESYRNVKRLGRKTRLSEAQRAILWETFDKVRKELFDRKLLTYSSLFSNLAKEVAQRKHPPYEFVVVDESQDLSIAQLRFLAAFGADKANVLFFAGDLGQRIFQQPFSWMSLGVDIRGRSKNLHVNYRTSHQIRFQADNLLGPEVSDVDGNKEDRKGTISLFNGPPPTVLALKTEAEEIKSVENWLRRKINEGFQPHEIGVFVRSEAQLSRAKSALENLKLPYRILDEHVETVVGQASICTMHLAKGLEFRAVVIMACDDEVLPLQERIESASDDSDLEEVYNTERHLLYVACTRARDQLLVTSVEPASEFLDDLRM